MICHQGNVNQTNNKTSLCTNQSGQIQNTNNKMRYNRKYHPLLVSMQNGTATLEGHMAVS